MSNAAVIQRLRAAIPSLDQVQAAVPTLFDVQNMGDDEVKKVQAAEKARQGFIRMEGILQNFVRNYQNFIYELSEVSLDTRQNIALALIPDIESFSIRTLSTLGETASTLKTESISMRKYLRRVSILKLRVDIVRMSDLTRCINHLTGIVINTQQQVRQFQDEVRRFAAEQPKAATNFPPQPPEQVDYDAVIDSVMARTTKARAYLAR